MADTPTPGETWRYRLTSAPAHIGKVLSLDDQTVALQPIKPHGKVIVRPRAGVEFVARIREARP